MRGAVGIAYFAYGTTQRGFPHYRELAEALGEPVGRFRTVEEHAVVVPREAACGNPGCRYVHRMAALVPGSAPSTAARDSLTARSFGLHAAGDVFLVGEDALAALDRLELSGPYVRTTIAVAGDGASYDAVAYAAAEPQRWAALVASGRAEALEVYPRSLVDASTLKPCCAAAPGHPPPHDVLDPLRGV